MWDFSAGFHGQVTEGWFFSPTLKASRVEEQIVKTNIKLFTLRELPAIRRCSPNSDFFGQVVALTKAGMGAAVAVSRSPGLKPPEM